MNRRIGAPLLPLGLAAILMGVLQAGPAQAFDFFDGRLQVHGFYESQIRAVARDFSASDDWDLTQLAHVLNVEIEADIAPDGWGPFDLVSGFGRIEVRYDCVYTRACGIFHGADAFGDGAKKYPKRMNDGRRSGYVGNQFTGDTREYRGEPIDTFRLAFKDRPGDSRAPYGIDRTRGFQIYFESPGADAAFGTADDPGPFIFDRYVGRGKCKFSSRSIPGYTDRVSLAPLEIGPNDPGCFVEPIAAFINKPNPFRPGDLNPLSGVPGSQGLPYRPFPSVPWAGSDAGVATDGPGEPGRADRAQGLWIPNKPLADMLRDGKIDHFDGNFRQDELAWNHGSSQQDEKELKELYLDLELLESRLWLRVGKQAIVWGKTELFRNQDQFNPQDLALSSLPSLEESRIALWAARGVVSLYDIGPFQDVRLEGAVNFDGYELNDFGGGGCEPYAPLIVCHARFGLLAHGFTGLGLAGFRTPRDPWNSWKGLEGGMRLEWRWDRFSFAITDFYGYQDLPYVEKIFTFERNVDPLSGRPRRLNSRERCITGAEEACLQGGTDTLINGSTNQTLWAMTCASLIGFISLDPSACGNSIFNSQEVVIGTLTFSDFFARTLAGRRSTPGGGLVAASGHSFYNALIAQTSGAAGIDPDPPYFAAIEARHALRDPLAARPVEFCQVAQVPLCRSPLVQLVRDGVQDGPGGGSLLGLDRFLTDEQEALLGCGPFYGTSCDLQGIDLLNAEASALVQSFPGIEGTFGIEWDTTDFNRIQPGTVGFDGGPACTRHEGGVTYVLPGCRGPGDPGYDPMVDGSTDGAVHPFAVDPGPDGMIGTGDDVTQPFRSEMAMTSWNLLSLLVAFSFPDDTDNPLLDEFIANDPFRTDGCSFARTQMCKFYSDFFRSVRTKRNTVDAGGNGKFGRRDFQWHDGTPLLIRFEKTNTLGFSMDFADDFTKSNWGIELTWVEDVPAFDNDEFDGLRNVDTYNMTISVDRPTFVNFLNANRTFFVNSQFFIQYIDGYRGSFPGSGPWNVLGTLTITTGYFQDRLLPTMTFVYDKRTNSAAFLPQLTYRFNENFSATFGLTFFSGRVEKKTAALNPVASTNRVGRGAYKDFVETNGLSAVRDRDEIYLRVKYTF